ncbi:MAG: diacylglycerol kinase [Gammaproteobacteria bacterium]|nr:diacylglycerol kinase [Gammaproteobacteria bacterium]
MQKNQRFTARLRYALAGIGAGWRENSFKTQLLFSCLAVAMLIFINPDLWWWALIVLLCGTILAAELFNTALEAICDHVSPEFQPAIKTAKDAAAGAVLILSVASLLIAVLLLIDWVK